MRKGFVAILVILFFALPGVAQSNALKCAPVKKSDWELDGARGKVKNIRTYKASFTEDEKTGAKVEEKRELEEEVSYDTKGNQTKWRNVNYLPVDPKDKLKATYTCDAKGRVSETRYLRVDGSLAKRITSDYDEQGREKERAYYFPDGILERKETYSYDEAGNLIEEIAKQQAHPEHFNPKRYDVYIVTKTSYKHDDKGNKIEELLFYPDGSLYATWTYSYDSNNRVIKHTQIDKEGRLQDQYIYKYDDEGRLVEEIHYANFCFYQDGRMCEGSVNSGDAIFYYATKTTYEYDRQGNWIKQSEFSMGSEKNKGFYEPDTTLYRKISYY